jgi:hypothetical protein
MALLPEPVTESWTPSSEFEKGAVQQQLEHLLACPLFNSSKRYAQFLRFVVTRALDGQAGQLKERVLGIEIFERPADYDTNIDPIVRVTAAEIRKRIDRYYQDPKHSQEIRLFLSAGSYAPQFSWPGHPNGLPGAEQALAAIASTELKAPKRSAPTTLSVRSSKRIFGKILVGATAVAVIAVAAWLVFRGSRPTLVQQFWEPFAKSPEPTLFCIADQVQYGNIRLRDAADPSTKSRCPTTW